MSTQFTLFKDAPGCGARLSTCRKYRYQLWRVWDLEAPYLNVIGLNPSTADENADDPTIRRCVGYAKDWGYGGLIMTNLFAWRATKPSMMKKAKEPIGKGENDYWLTVTSHSAGLVLAAWGIHGTFQERDKAVIQMLPELHCLGTNDDRTPKHPLFLSKKLKPILYSRD
jgi:hypothetical protein